MIGVEPNTIYVQPGVAWIPNILAGLTTALLRRDARLLNLYEHQENAMKVS